MRISQISVSDLFGIFNHSIPLEDESQITIIHGPNGIGKTILLTMLDGLFNGRYTVLRRIPFKRFDVGFHDGTRLWVNKETTQQLDILKEIGFSYEESIRKETVTLNIKNGQDIKTASFTLKQPKPTRHQSRLVSVVEEYFPFLVRVGPRLWQDIRTEETIGLEEVLNQYGEMLPMDALEDSEEPPWWVDLRKSVNIHFIETQRLVTFQSADRNVRSRTTRNNTVEQYSAELSKTIQRKLREYANLSQRLDRTFPSRLVKQLGKSKLTDEELRERLVQLEKKRLTLKEAGLLAREEDVDFQPSAEIAGATIDVLAIYVQDVKEKLSVFDEITSKIELFMNIINTHFEYTLKEISISAEDGFSFKVNNASKVPLAALSSGEQHEIVLMYQLLFKVKPNTLILIDEPEISLHVGWQKEFLKDLEEILELVSFDVLLATHSPQLISDRWDLTVNLKGPSV